MNEGDEYDEMGMGMDDMDMDMDMDMEYGDMDMDEEYGDMGMGYGQQTARRGGSSQSSMSSIFSNAFASTFQSANLASLAAPDAAAPIQSGPVLINDATVAYAKGDYQLAMRLFFGHIVAEYDDAQNSLNLVKYSRQMQRPAWQIRWGVSYTVRGEATDAQPIQDTGPSTTRRGRNQRGFGGGDQGGMGMEEMGMEMEEMSMEMEEMGMGMEGMDERGMGMDERGMGMGMGPGGRRRAAAPTGPPTPVARLAALEKTMLDPKADKALVDTIGVVATILGEQFDKRYAQGDFGRALTDVTAGSGSVDTVSEGFVDLLESSPESPLLWRPGIVFMGKGFLGDITTLAQKESLDLLLHIDILLKPLNNGHVQNLSKCRIVHVPSRKSLGVSKSIDSIDFEMKSGSKGQSARDYVNDKIEAFLAIIDRQTITTDMPQLTSEIAKRRIGSLLASGGAKNLRTLAEVRLFQSQNLLNDEEVQTAFDIVGGEEALQLLYGSESERLRIVRDWASGKSSETE